MTNWDYYEAVKRFQRVLEVSGINGALKARGVRQVRRVGLACVCVCTAGRGWLWLGSVWVTWFFHAGMHVGTGAAVAGTHGCANVGLLAAPQLPAQV